MIPPRRKVPQDCADANSRAAIKIVLERWLHQRMISSISQYAQLNCVLRNIS
jgi:hypothetical protein